MAQLQSTTVTGTLTLPSYVAGFVKLNSSGAVVMDTNTYITGITSGMITTALGYTPVPTTRTLTINGTAYDLSADRSWTIAAGVASVTASGAGISASPTTGAVVISNTGVTSNVAGTGISVSGATGAVTITNTGVTSIVAGTGISISGATGAVTVTNSGVTSVNGSSGAITGVLTTSNYSSTLDSVYLKGTTSPSTPGNFTLSIGNNGSYSYVQSHSSQPLYLNPLGNAVFIGSGNTVLHSGNYNSYAPTLTGGGASGTWGINITGNSATTSQRSFSGDISTGGMGRFTGWYTGTAATTLATEVGVSSGEGYIIVYNRNSSSYGTLNLNAVNIRIDPQGGIATVAGSQIVTNNGGTWGINITGNSATTSQTNFTTLTLNSATVATQSWVTSQGYVTGGPFVQNVLGDSGAFNLNVSGQQAFFRFSQGNWVNAPVAGNFSHVLSVNGATDNRTVQIYLGDVPGYLWWRPNQGGTWHPWERILTSNNYNSWAPTLTGGGASGTWSINITGNAATATTASTANSVAWSNISAGYRTNYDLGFRPADNSSSYGGFRFASPGNDGDAGYFLIRGGADNDVYTQNGITLVADLGWLTLAQRTQSNKGVRIMTGSTSTTRLQIDSSGNTDVGLGAGTVTLYHGGSARFWTGSDGTRTQGWAYFQNTTQGLHWPGNNWHLHPANSSDFIIRSGNNTDSALRFDTNGTTRGYVYAESDNTIGFLNNGRGWALRVYSDNNIVTYGHYLTVGQGRAWSSILMHDSDEGTREIHCNSNRIGFLTQAGSWGAYCNDNGSWESASSVTTNDWFYVNGANGIYWSSYGGGWRMQNTSYIEMYGSKSLDMKSGSVDYVGSLYIEGGGQGGHIQPNTTGSYGALQMTGSRNGWPGIYFTAAGTSLMINSNESGFYRQGYGWQMRWENGTGYVNKNGQGGGTSASILDSSNYTSWAAPRNYVGDSYVDFYIYGDQNTYYPVTIQNYNNGYGFQRYSISRGYSWTAPWNPIGTGSHQGGLTFTFEWAGDIAWGGNDKSFRIIEFAEQYTSMVAGMQLAHCEGLIVWLRGGGSGGAHYRLHGPGGIVQGYSINMSSWTSCAGVTYSPRSYSGSTVDSEINSRYPVRGFGNSDIYVNNSIVWHQGNLTNLNQLSNGPGYITSSALGSYLPLSGGTLSGNLNIQTGNNPAHFLLRGTNSELYVDAGYGGGTARLIINRQGTGNQAALHFTTGATVSPGSAWNSTGAPLWTMGMTNSSQTSDFKIAYGDIYDAASVAVRIDTSKNAYFSASVTVASDLRGTDVYTTGGWFRNHSNNNGIYWSNTAWHLYPADSSDFYMRSGNNDASIRFLRSDGTTMSYLHTDSGYTIGFLTNTRNWRFYVTNSGAMQAFGPIRRNSHLSGWLEGSYNNVGSNDAKSNPIYTIGSSYNPTESSLSNMYGVGYSHPNFWGGGKVAGWGLYVASNGVIDAVIGGDGASTSIWAKTDIVAYSDARVKENVQVVENALEKIQSIRGVTFTRNDVKDTSKRSAGVIAQEVLPVFPEVVTGSEEHMYSVAYGNMAALFIEAIKEQQTQIEELKSKLDGLTK